MNKAELIEAVSTQTSLQKADATRAVDAVFDSITSALKSGDTVALLGFGTVGRSVARILAEQPPPGVELTCIFNRDVARKRVDWVPTSVRWTNETIQIPASKVPGFKAGKALKDAVN